MAHGGEIGTEGATAQIVGRRVPGRIDGGQDHRFQRGESSEAGGLAKRHKPHGG